MKKSVTKYLLSCLFALSTLLAPSVWGQSVASSTISGVVLDATGKSVSGALVSVLHVPTNSTTTTVTNAAGRYNVPGLRVGGPYTVSATANGVKTNELTDVNLDLSQVYQADLSIGSGEVVKMDAFVATADSNTLFDSYTTGSGTELNQRAVQAVTTISRSITDYVRLDPRVVITDKTNGETSANGQNGRYNSIQIDGVRSNDVFGLTSNGLPSQSNPISIDTIDAFNLEVTPFDITRSGFTGASFNAVTKSGTNEFHGSAQYIWTNQNMRAKNEDATNVNYGKRESFSEKTLSATLGGPIIRDKLFFFASYEKYSRLDPVATPGFQPTDAAISAIASAFKAYNYDIGTLSNSGNAEKKDSKVLAKIDWNISSSQRLSVRYNKTKGEQPIFQDFTSFNSISFSNHWYKNEQKDTNYVATLFSNWSPNFKTELKTAFSEYKTDRTSNGTIFPQVVIGLVPSTAGAAATGTVFVGTENSTQLNHLKVNNNNYTFTGTYLLNDHTLTFGADYENNKFYNAFAQGVDGTYGTGSATLGFNFSALSATGISGGAINYSYQYSPTNGSLAADWGFTNPALFIQDQWHINNRLTVTAGLRLDTFTSDKPGYNAAFSTYAWSTLGGKTLANNNSFDGNKLFAPRVSFNYAIDSERKTQVHGGVGVFQGKGPGVWLSNNFSNNGLLIAQTTQATLRTDGVNVIPFQPDPTKQLKGATSPTFAVNAMDNGFKLPSALKLTLAVDRKLPWMGLIGTLSYDETRTLENYYYQDINLLPVGVLPDGRARYNGRVNPRFTNVYLIKNTKKGDAYNITTEIKKPWRNHWSANFAYTRGSSHDVSPVTSSTAQSNFGARMVYNTNDDQLGISNYQVKHRFITSASRELVFFKNYRTTVSAFYEARSGRPYSYVSSGDVNGDTANQSNDLFYVPTGPSDPKVRFGAAGSTVNNQAQSDAFFGWLRGMTDLQKYSGGVAPRNIGTSKWIHQLDANVSQEVPIWGKLKGELRFDIFNLGNLLNSHWGRHNQVGFPYNFIVTPATYDSAANQYVYNYNGPTKQQTLDSTLTRWQIQTTLRIRF